MPTENELLSNVDALLEQVAQDDLPPPAERRRLREAAGLSQAQVAKALDTRREAVGNWEAGRTEPRPPQRAAYAKLLEKLAERFPAPDSEAPDEPAVPETFDGALVFACLLHLTDHRESAQFWWQLAAGAGHRAAAYCLHLHHLSLGETREARHWLHEVTDDVLDSEAPDGTFLATLEAVATYVRRTGSSLASAPTGGLEMEVDRLATEKTDSCIIVQRPDRRLADLLHDFTRR